MAIDVMQVIQGAFLTVGALLIFIAIIYFGNIIFDQDKLHRTLNIKLGKTDKFFEFLIFKFSLYLLLACWSVLMLMQWWGVPKHFTNAVKHALLEGHNIYNINIIPMRLILALMVFAIIQMSWKYTLLYLSKVRKVDLEADGQVAITSLISYVIVAVAILCGLLVSGVDFTGLAIVAGALSVGIGFGLQNIVNNFVSGIIILLENTVKPGDRVLIKGQEGFIRKISFRYTRIETPFKEDVIIPNSDLITTPIINYEFENRLSTIKCIVGVAYGSDLEMVQQVLLNVALKHPDVLRDPINKPTVYLNEFGDSNLIFELQCVVSDVNKTHKISSALNLSIAKAFTENNIVMDYPRRNVQIISSQENPPLT